MNLGKRYMCVLCIILFATYYKFEIISKWNIKNYAFVSSYHNKLQQSSREFFFRPSGCCPLLLFKEFGTVCIWISPKDLQTPVSSWDPQLEKMCILGRREVETLIPRVKLSTCYMWRFKALIFSDLSSKGSLPAFPHNSFTEK